MIIESLGRLNHHSQVAQSDETIIAFFILPAKTNNSNVGSLKGHAILNALSLE